MTHGTTGWRMRTVTRSALLLAGLCFAVSLPGGTISGTVRDDAKEAVPNATVMAVKLAPALAESVAPVTEEREARSRVRLAVTGFDGDFAFGDLSPGSYRICVEKRHALLLNPCEWGTPTELTLGDAQAAEKVAISVRYGKAVRVRIDDPEDALTLTAAAKTGDPLLGLAVLDAKGILHDVRPGAKDRKGREYEIVVPPAMQLQLVVNSRNAELVRGSPEQKSTLSKDHAKVAFTVEADATVDTVLRLEMRRAKK